MTDKMPNEIWVDENNSILDRLDTPMEGDTKYIRADLTPQWQPIETAPKDGVEILGFDSKNKTYHVTIYDGYSWHNPDNHYYSEALGFYPTHWMPLPTPPKGHDDE